MSRTTYTGMRIAHNDGRFTVVLKWCPLLSDIPRGGERYENALHYPFFRTPSATHPEGIGGYVLTTLTPQTQRFQRRRQSAPYRQRQANLHRVRTYCGRCVIDHLGFDYGNRCSLGRPSDTTPCSVCRLTTQTLYFTTQTR